MKQVTAFLLCFMILISSAATVAADDSLSVTATYLINTVTDPTVATIGGEWTVIGLARSGLNIDKSYFETYYANVETYVKAKEGVLHARKHSEYSRVILALRAIGKNPEDVAGYNLVNPLLDYDKTVRQGINGAIWALIALDSGDYGTPEIRDRYINHILAREKEAGGWAMADGAQSAEADITAMVLIALSHDQDRQDVRSASERAIHLLSSLQNEKGGYSAYHEETSESTAQVLTALSALGISYQDPRFVKNGSTLKDHISSFRQPDGSFSHTDASNLMATEQCFYALVAAQRMEEQKPPLFDLRDGLEETNGLTLHRICGWITRAVVLLRGHKHLESVTLRELFGSSGVEGMIPEGMPLNPELPLTREQITDILNQLWRGVGEV